MGPWGRRFKSSPSLCENCAQQASVPSRWRTIGNLLSLPIRFFAILREAGGCGESKPGRRSGRISRPPPPSGVHLSRSASHDASASSKGRHQARRHHCCFLHGCVCFPSPCLLSASTDLCFFKKSDRESASFLLLTGRLAVVDDCVSNCPLIPSIAN